MTAGLLFLGLSACVQTTPQGPDPDVTGTTNLPDPAGPEVQVDAFGPSTAAVDVLLIVDTGPSMAEEQVALTSAAAELIDTLRGSGFDFHLGVISTDMETPSARGHLRAVGSTLWIDGDTLHPESVAVQMLTLGTGGGASRGLDAAQAAVALAEEGSNKGFLRDHASFAMVAFSDRDDVSTVSPADFASWSDELRPDPDWVTFSSFVDPAATTYLEATALVGGEAHGPTAAVDQVLPTVVLEAALWSGALVLSRQPVVDTLEVWAEDGATIILYEDEDWSYKAPSNTIVVHEYIPSPDAGMYARYEVLDTGTDGDPGR